MHLANVLGTFAKRLPAVVCVGMHPEKCESLALSPVDIAH